MWFPKMGAAFKSKEEVHRERPQLGRLPASFISQLRAVSADNGFDEPQAPRIMHREAKRAQVVGPAQTGIVVVDLPAGRGSDEESAAALTVCLPASAIDSAPFPPVDS